MNQFMIATAFVLLTVLMTITGPCIHASSAVKTMHLTPGESITVDFPAGSNIKVSRKGVVDVFALSETSWQLTALRGGLVIVDAVDGSTGTPHLPRIFVDVKSASSGERPIVAVGIPDWVCKKRGIQCDSEAGIVSGILSDYKWLLRSIAWCHSSRSCVLFVSLTESGRKNLQNFLQERLGDDFQVVTAASGQSMVSSLCDPVSQDQHTRTIESLLPRFIEDKILNFTCGETQNTYKVSVKAHKVSTSEGVVSGYDGNLKTAFIYDTGPALSDRFSGNLRASSSIKSEHHNAATETIGAPVFLASENIEFQALIGGELPYLTDTGRQSTASTTSTAYQWKEYGLSIKGKIKSMRGERIRTAMELFLKSVNDQPGRGLSTSSLKSNIETKAREWTLIGELDLASDMDGKKTTPMLAGIPIVGPLFQLTQKSKSKTRLQVWVHIEKM